MKSICLRELQRTSCQPENEVVDKFDCRWLERKNEVGCPNRLHNVFEVDDAQSAIAAGRGSMRTFA